MIPLQRPLTLRLKFLSLKKMFTAAPDALPQQQGVKHYFIIPNLGFAAIGIDPTSTVRPIRNRCLLSVCLLGSVTLTVAMAQYVAANADDMNLVTGALSPFWQCLLAISKCFIVLWNKHKIVKLVRKIMLWNLQETGEDLEIIAKENKKTNTISTIFYGSGIFTTVLALATPFVIASFRKCQGRNFLESLVPPLKAAYILDYNKTYFGYTFAFLWDVLLFYYAAHATLATDTLFSWVIYNIAARFQILRLRFKIEAQKAIGNVDGTFHDDRFCQSIKYCVDYHRRTLTLVDMFNDVFKAIVCLKFAISCMEIACLAYQLARGSELSAQAFALSFLSAVSLQMAVYCYGGQRLQDESTSIGEAIEEHFHWDSLSSKSKKLLLLPLMRARKPCAVTGVFFVADLRLFLWVYRTAASFIALLMTMDDKGG